MARDGTAFGRAQPRCQRYENRRVADRIDNDEQRRKGEDGRVPRYERKHGLSATDPRHSFGDFLGRPSSRSGNFIDESLRCRSRKEQL